jgi:hypothetical protein
MRPPTATPDTATAAASPAHAVISHATLFPIVHQNITFKMEHVKNGVVP